VRAAVAGRRARREELLSWRRLPTGRGGGTDAALSHVWYDAVPFALTDPGLWQRTNFCRAKMTEAPSSPRCASRQVAAPRSRRALLATLVSAASFLLAACGGGDSGSTVLPRPSTVSTVRITPTAATVDVGGTFQLAAAALDASGTGLAGRTFTWTSLTPAVATVSSAGLVTGVTAGNATISVAADGVTGTAVVGVTVPVSARCDPTTPIDIGQTVAGSIANTDCRLADGSYGDKYVLTLTEATPVRISMVASLNGVDAFLILQNAATGAIIAKDDDGNGDTNARIEQVIPAGRYVIIANTFDATDFGDYQLTVSRAAPACLTATSIGSDATVSGTLASTACMLPDSSFVDRYTLTVTNSTIFTATMHSDVFDSYLFVESTTGESIQRNDNGGGGRDARISTTLAAGTYIIYANSAAAKEIGAYTLKTTSKLDPCGVNRSVTVGSTIGDTLVSTSCRLADGSFVKRFSFSVTASTPVRIDLTSTQFDPYIFVQQAGSATKLAEDDDSGPGLNAEVLQVFAPGDYVITATSATAGETGQFDLALAGPVQTAVSLGVTPTTATLQPGLTQQLTATVTGTTNSNVLWTSSATGIATVSSTGVVRAITAGSANITVTSAADASKTATANITVTVGTGVNLDLPLVYLTQSVQTTDGRIPLVAGRPTLVRVFVRGSSAGLGTAAVRVRFFNGSSLLGTVTGTAIIASTLDESCCAANIIVPDAYIRDGVTLIADVDPGNAIAETNEGDNAWPLTGASKPIRLVTVPVVNIQLVPILHRTTNLVSSPTPQLTTLLQAMYPLSVVNVTVHAEYATDTPPLTDANSWLQMLSQIDALRTLENGTSYYFGVLNQQSAPGIVGIAGIGAFAGVGVGGPDGRAQETLTHEFGHSFGRQHSPTPTRCGTPAGVDANYPRADGTIGIVGYDIGAGTLYAADRFDIMGYCDATWASEYTYSGILAYLKSGLIPGSGGIAQQSVLLITGSLSNGAITVDPVFATSARASVSRAAGRFVAEGLSADGRVLFSHRFDGSAVGDLDAASRTFVVAVPYDASVSGAVASITVRDEAGGGRTALRTRAGVYTGVPGGVNLRVDADPQLSVRTSGSGRFDITWNTGRYPSLVVRNTRTHRVLAIGRNGALNIEATSLTDLEVLLSDGVSSNARPLTLTGAP
jgi:uncharacterized protein YjdB